MKEIDQIAELLLKHSIKFDPSYSMEHLRRLHFLASMRETTGSKCFGDRDANDPGPQAHPHPCKEEHCNAALMCQELTDHNKGFVGKDVSFNLEKEKEVVMSAQATESAAKSVSKKDVYGFREGTKFSKIAAILAKGGLTRKELLDLVVKDLQANPKTATTQIYNVKKKLTAQGIKVEFKE
jgi:hypothetical protein